MQKKGRHTERFSINAARCSEPAIKNTRTIPAISPAAVRVSNKQAYAKRASGVILLLCIMLAVLASVLVPLLVGGASPAIAAAEVVPISAAVAKRAENSYSSVQEAQNELGFTPKLPTMPEGASLVAIRVVDGTMLEMEYSLGKTTVLYRTAQGSEDLSDINLAHAFSITEEGAVPRSYAGSTEGKLSSAVWATEGYTYAIQTNNDISADIIKGIATSVA